MLKLGWKGMNIKGDYLNLVKLSKILSITTFKKMKKLFLFLTIFSVSFVSKAQQRDLSHYVGVFKFTDAPFSKLIVTQEGSSLVADAEGVGKGEITATNVADEFGEPNYQALIKFLRDGSGKVHKVRVTAGGDEFEGSLVKPSLDEYVGKYSLKDSPDVSEVEVNIQGGVLFVNASVGSTSLSSTNKKDVFMFDATDGGIAFERDTNGKVIGVEIVFSGQTIKGQKK